MIGGLFGEAVLPCRATRHLNGLTSPQVDSAHSKQRGRVRGPLRSPASHSSLDSLNRSTVPGAGSFLLALAGGVPPLLFPSPPGASLPPGVLGPFFNVILAKF